MGYLSAFATAVARGPGLLVMTSRVDSDPLDAAWRASCHGTPFTTIDLGPLRSDEAMTLAGTFVDATQRIALACIARAGGNPLFLEQLLRNAEEGSGEAVPATIQSLVLARMDRLAPLDRQAFQAAAVIGQRFGLALLRHLIDQPDYVCDGLVANALVLPEGEDFLFAHALIQEGAYSTSLRARRRELHRRAAGWFAPNDPVLCAQHLDRAEDERAPRAYLDAATVQRAGYFTDAALRLVQRGLDIARNNEDRHALMCLKGELQRDLGDIVEGVVRILDVVPAANPGADMTHPDPATSYAPYRLYNIGNNRPVKLTAFIEMLEHALGRKAVKNLLPMQPGDVPATYADVEDLRRVTGFSPSTPLEEGIARYVAWYREYYDVPV